MKNTARFLDKQILVLGLAKSGTAAAELLLKLGARVTVNDRKPLEENVEAQRLQKLGAEVVCGSHPPDLVGEHLDYLVKNPGIRYDNPLIVKAASLRIPVITEVELAYEISEAEIIGITGSNGKTTTTTYLFEMLKDSQKTPLIAGNIGEVACEVAQQATEKNVLVTELSSFQLMGTEMFRPKISVLLNLIEAHIDYHGTMDDYIAAKANIFKNQAEGDYIVYNADDPKVTAVVQSGQAAFVPFSTEEAVQNGACVENGWLSVFGKKLIRVEEMSLPGLHNVANGLAAAAAAFLAGADIERIRTVLKTFAGVAHRLQFVDSFNDRSFYNNSKATNVTATITALKAFEKPVVLLAGGLDRGNGFDELLPYLEQRVSGIVTYGETGMLIAETAKRAGVETVKTCSTLREAVPLAYEISAPGDTILLSPACASWDQFNTFEERGDTFIDEVKKIVR
ncbi:UDP-N-acetylmuramoylalanine--D-glutamate ligase [Evansella caseinilytica]|uniref:UDP-N-acetylmuramoylalanine--D-glutamate ligase n=1 Tax=Evansella caseinilytica TaxID=1503961 RepID=A0A1H3MH80_9BACI|nr:UDP-N-acetylmuramoyl-L-alanine--D-glutamate ligase [Evansella caseinilytica]SDY76042.1 UDP-N-acetylmuramoylalanine--D-glutamate ligase [Evansella caseinilytica]